MAPARRAVRGVLATARAALADAADRADGVLAALPEPARRSPAQRAEAMAA